MKGYMGEKTQKLSCLYDACPKLLLLTIKNYHKYSVFMNVPQSGRRRRCSADLSTGEIRSVSERLTLQLVLISADDRWFIVECWLPKHLYHIAEDDGGRNSDQMTIACSSIPMAVKQIGFMMRLRGAGH